MSRVVMDVEGVAPCVLCHQSVTVYDYTNNTYGFDGYEIECKCGIRFKSIIPHEFYMIGDTIHTPMTEASKKLAYDKMISDWSRR